MKTNENTNMSSDDIKKEILLNVGKHIIIKEYNKQGKLIKQFSGEILNCYNNLFLVKIKINSSYLNKSFSFIDFLTNDLKYEILN